MRNATPRPSVTFINTSYFRGIKIKMAKDAQALKVRKKKWFNIIAPRLFREVPIGEILLYESADMKGRRLTVNMMNLTNNPKNQHITVKLRIVDVKDGKGVTEFLGFQTTPSSIKRYVRRGRTKLEDSFIIQTADRKNVRIKPLIITSSVVPKSVTGVIKRVVRNSIARLAQKLTFDKLLEEIMSFKLQKHIGGMASRVTPIRNCEIKAFLLVEKEGAKPIVPSKENDLPEKKEEESFDTEDQAKMSEAASDEPQVSQADELEAEQNA
jgi:small subunit ribosomal protein S3Ae